MQPESQGSSGQGGTAQVSVPFLLFVVTHLSKHIVVQYLVRATATNIFTYSKMLIEESLRNCYQKSKLIEKNQMFR